MRMGDSLPGILLMSVDKTVTSIVVKQYITLLNKIPDMHYVYHKLVKNTLPSHYVKHDDTRVPPNCRGAQKQTVSRHTGWLDLNLKRVLSVECVELSP
jgi:hypothetical protein